MGTGWASWDEPRQPRPVLDPVGADRVRYCPRCDKRTVWKANGEGVCVCECGVTVTTILTAPEVDRLRRHYRIAA